MLLSSSVGFTTEEDSSTVVEMFGSKKILFWPVNCDNFEMVSRVKYCVDIVLADSAHSVSVVLVVCSMFLTRVAFHSGWSERRGCEVH